MRFAKISRSLTPAEQTLASSVFGTTLPAWNRVLIADGLGLGDAPWTDNPAGNFKINMGPTGYPDATSSSALTTPGGSFGRICDTFIHEMTHVWQYFHGNYVKLSSVGSYFAGGYAYTLGSPWDSYNVEQQAKIVEHWFKRGMSTTDAAYTYITGNIRAGKTK
jgi:hypothetical protein